MSVARRLIRFAGSALSIGCIAWIGWSFHSTGLLEQLSAEGSFRDVRWRVLLAMPVYALAVLVLGIAWAALQRVFIENVTGAPIVSTYLITQAYKYLPGGVLQYVGRHVALRKQGASHAALALCAFAEAACLIAVASATSASFAIHLGIRLDAITIWLAILFSLCIVVVGIDRLRQRVRWVEQRVPTFRVGWLAVALGLYAIFFLLMALTLAQVVPAEFPVCLPLTTWAAIAAASWIAGFVVIGAPAGIGVREAVFISLLTGITTRPAILLIAACFRAATFGGDVMAYVAGLLWKWYQSRTAVARIG